MANAVLVLLAVVAAALLIFLFATSLRKGGKSSKQKPVEQQQSTPPPPTRPVGAQPATADNLEQLISQFPGTTHVFFYAPWCGFCKTAKPKFQQIAQGMDPNSFQFLLFDCEAAKELAGKYVKPTYPTIVKFRNSSLQPVNQIVGDQPLNQMATFIES